MKPESRQTVYTTDQIIALLVRAGIPNEDIPMMVALALAESEGKVGAVGDKNLVNEKWDESIGLWQIRSLKNPNDPTYNDTDKLRVKEKLFDPVYNAQVAYAISKQGKDWTDWSTYNDEKYKRYMPAGPARSELRDKIQVAGGGIRGRSKPITMAEEQNNQTTITDIGRALPPSVYDPELKKLLKVKKETEKDYNKIKKGYEIGDYSQEELDAAKQKLDDINQEITTRSEKAIATIGQPEPGADPIETARTKLNEARVKQQKLQKAFESKETVLEVAGRATTKKRVTRSMLAEANSEVAAAQSAITKLETQKPVTEERALPVNQATKVDFGGQPKPKVPQGTGETVYLGELETTKQVAVPKVPGATRTVGATTSEPADLKTLEGMWFSNAPEAKKLVDKFKAVYAANGKTATERDWKEALAATAGINMSNGGQTLWETAETMLKTGALGGTGGGPSAKELNNRKETVRLLATELGVELSEGQVNSIGYSYANGELDATTIRSRIAQIGNINFSMGEASKTVDALKQTAAAYGVSYSPDWYTQSAKDILTGKVDNDTLNQQFKELAKSRYPSLVKQIDAGYTVKQIASPYLQSMATILEINPNDISLEDPTIKQAFTSIDDQGQPSTRPLWQFEKELKQDPRWAYTKNAQQELMGTAYKVLSDFGLVF